MRMRATLVEVLGPERGEAMYTLEWLEARVRFHFDRDQCEGEVFGAYTVQNDLIGHAIVRKEAGESGEPFGLFSTIYVLPERRRVGVAEALMRAGEAWMCERQLSVFRTYTDENNVPLIRLFESHRYTIVLRKDEFVILEKAAES